MQLLRKKVMNEIRELTEMEVEAVSGGALVNINVKNSVDVPTNIAVPTAVAVGVGGGATAANLIGIQKIFGVQA
jgi:NCAIR mutase (PurE)-related protein